MFFHSMKYTFLALLRDKSAMFWCFAFPLILGTMFHFAFGGLGEDKSFSAIPGGELHPQAVAPGYQMYTCWMIRHIDGNPWLQTDRCEDERYTWLHDAEF